MQCCSNCHRFTKVYYLCAGCKSPYCGERCIAEHNDAHKYFCDDAYTLSIARKMFLEGKFKQLEKDSSQIFIDKEYVEVLEFALSCSQSDFNWSYSTYTNLAKIILLYPDSGIKERVEKVATASL